MLIKFCGMRRREDLAVAADLGAGMCGFIFHEPSPRYISPYEAAALPSPGMKRVGVFVRQSWAEILEIKEIARLDLIQLHGDQGDPPKGAPSRESIIRTVWPERFNNIQGLNALLRKLAPSCGMFLLDAGKSLGGSGRRVDASLLAGLESPLPWLLAGGLSPDNIDASLLKLGMAGLDASSGLESAPGIKDHALMKSFIINLRKISAESE